MSGKDSTNDKGSSIVLFEALTGFVCFVAQVMGCFAFITTMAIGVIPMVGVTIADVGGITADMTVIAVMAMWLVPQIFVAGLCCVATVAFCKWWWKACKRVAGKLDALFANKVSGKDGSEQDGSEDVVDSDIAADSDDVSSEQPAKKGAHRRRGRRKRRGKAPADTDVLSDGIIASEDVSGETGGSEDSDG